MHFFIVVFTRYLFSIFIFVVKHNDLHFLLKKLLGMALVVVLNRISQMACLAAASATTLPVLERVACLTSPKTPNPFFGVTLSRT
jgi:hypothetical protein